MKRGEHGFVRQIVVERKSIDDESLYPFNIPALAGLNSLSFHKSITFLIGENGSGKSTLLEALAVLLKLNPEGGSQNFNFAHRPSESTLHKHLRLVRSHRTPWRRFFLRAESLFNVATQVEERGLESEGWESIHERSHGEAFLYLLVERFGKNGLYLMDEPEAALSPKRQLAMLARMNQLVEQGCQFIIATHSPILMAFPNAMIYLLDPSGINKVNYRDTEHYQITRDFLLQPESFLKHLT